MSFNLPSSFYNVRISLLNNIQLKEIKVVEEKDQIYIGLDLSKQLYPYYDAESKWKNLDQIGYVLYTNYVSFYVFHNDDSLFYNECNGMDRKYLSSHANKIMDTDVYKRIRTEVDSIVNRVKVNMSLEKSQYPKLKDRNILPLFWFDLNTSRVIYNRISNTYSYRKGQDYFYFSLSNIGDVAKSVVSNAEVTRRLIAFDVQGLGSGIDRVDFWSS